MSKAGSKPDTTRRNLAFALPLDLANAPDIDGGGRPANSAEIQKLADYLERARLEGWDRIMIVWHTPDGTTKWEAWGAWPWWELAGFLMRAVRKLTE
jgi:hypothetical protein